MKRALILVLLLIVSSSMFAQYDFNFQPRKVIQNEFTVSQKTNNTTSKIVVVQDDVLGTSTIYKTSFYDTKVIYKTQKNHDGTTTIYKNTTWGYKNVGTLRKDVTYDNWGDDFKMPNYNESNKLNKVELLFNKEYGKTF